MPNLYMASYVPMPWGHVDTDVFAAWGQWVGGIGSIAAVVTALYISISDTRRRDREKQDHLAAQARTVTATVEVVQVHTTASGRPMRASGVVVNNHGARPIMDVDFENVFVTIGDQTFERWALRERTSGPIQVASVIGPGESESITRIRFDVTNDYDAQADWTYTVTFSFQDADGLRWRRIGNGPPARVLNRLPATEGW